MHLIHQYYLISALIIITLGSSAPANAQEQRTPPSSMLPAIEYTYEGLIVEGNNKTSLNFFRTLIGIRPGDRVSISRLEEFRHRLLVTGYFDRVDTRLSQGSEPGSVLVVLRVEERNTIVIRDLFLGLGNYTPFWGGLEVADTHFWGTGLLLSLGFVLSAEQGAVRMTVADHFAATGLPFGWQLEGFLIDSIGTGPSLTTSGAYSELAFGSQRLGARMGLSLHPLSFLDLRTNLRVEGLEFSFLQPASHPPITSVQEGGSLLSVLELEVSFNFQHRPWLPSSGFSFNFKLDGSSSLIGSDFEYLRSVSQADYGWLIGNDQILRFELLAGIIWGAQNAPYFEGFYVGDLFTIVPSRSLELQFTDRRPLDIFDTGAVLVTHADRFARFLVEWTIPFWHDRRSLNRVEMYCSLGIVGLLRGPWSIGRHPGLLHPEPAEVLESLHLDLDFDLGIRGNTPIGQFTLSLGRALALLPFN